MSTPFLAKVSTRSGSLGRTTVARRPSTAVSCSWLPSLEKRTRSTLPASTAFTNSLYLHCVPSGRPLLDSAFTSGAVREVVEDWNCMEAGWACSTCCVGGAGGGADTSSARAEPGTPMVEMRPARAAAGSFSRNSAARVLAVAWGLALPRTGRAAQPSTRDRRRSPLRAKFLREALLSRDIPHTFFAARLIVGALLWIVVSTR
mmetsp:Transcript_98/g.208  ORF Transcript_98/g.208 Transcript_98/m.208 type:complete len:203 (-) Transcript_98:80-688(-)